MSVDSLYLVTAGLFSLFGLHRGVLLCASFFAKPSKCQALNLPGESGSLPFVTVQLPLYNERFVVEPLLESAARMRYPRELLEIQVLDDSTDETVEVVERQVQRLRSQGVPIVHLRRDNRQGFKAGALQYGLERTKGEILVVFDADFLPTPDFLLQIVPEFQDPQVGLVQARWGHINRMGSMLTRAQALQLDGHFLVEHLGRKAADLLLNFNGTAGAMRKSMLLDAGGWEWETLTEDLDLSCRAQMAGWKFLYRPDIVVPAQLPESFHAFKSQQRRWTRGAIQTARKLLLPIWTSRLRPWRKLEASALLLGNSVYPLFLLFLILHGVLWAVLDAHSTAQLRTLDTQVLGMATGLLWLFYAVASHRSQQGFFKGLLEVPFLMAVGAGMSVNNSIAFFQGLLGGPGVFERTPKEALGQESNEPEGEISARRTSGQGRPTYRARGGMAFLLEFPLFCFLAWTSSKLLERGWEISALFYGLFSVGLAYLLTGTLWESWQRSKKGQPGKPVETNSRPEPPEHLFQPSTSYPEHEGDAVVASKS